MKLIPEYGDSKAILRVGMLLSLVYAFFILNWRVEIVRFSYEPLNNLFFLLVLTIPTLLIVLCLRFPQKWMKTASFAVLILPAIGSLILAVLTLLVLPDAVRNNAPALETRIRTIAMQHYDLDVLRGDYLVTIRQEKRILPGLRLVRRIYLAPGTDVQVTVLDADRAMVVSGIDAESGGRILNPKRNVYF